MRTLDKIITEVCSKSGAPMGRRSYGKKPTDDQPVFDCKVKLTVDGYDYGGAYWGIGNELRVSYTNNLSYVKFYRT